MRTIAHLSDLHFGRVHEPMLKPLVRIVGELRPDLVAVSGDLTQRARRREFREARQFLDELPGPQIVVPGNHDVPLYRPLFRIFLPLARYRRFISRDPLPLYEDDEMAVIGADTTRALVAKGGRINIGQVKAICSRFLWSTGPRMKIVVTHHPFDLPAGYASFNLVGRARKAMESFARCGVDLFLSGHLHVAHTGNTARYMIQGFSALVIEAGTVISTRGRGELNSFNLIRIHAPRVSVETWSWEPGSRRFSPSAIRHFEESDFGWIDCPEG